MRTIRAVARAVRLPWRERREAVVAASLLAYANLALKLLPFSRAISIGSVAALRISGDRESAIADAVRAVRRASYAVPWRSVCIHEGLAAQIMLRRQGVPAILCYGTSASDAKLRSHVWVKVGDLVVIGGEEAPGYQLVATYPEADEASTSRPFSSANT